MEVKCHSAVTGRFTWGGWMGTRRLGPYRALGQLATSVTATGHRSLVTQNMSTSVIWAQHLAWDHQGNSHFLAVLQQHSGILAKMTLSGLFGSVCS